MRMTAVETVQVEEYSNLLWVRLHTDAGLVGLGETFRNPQATAAYIHETCAPYLVGRDPLQVERHGHALMHRVGNHFNGFPTRSVEIRGNSAVDMALWDLVGQALGAPLYQLLGGLAHERVPIYNTCAGYAYNARARAGANTQQVRRGQAPAPVDPARPYEDLEAQVHRPGDLAESLLGEGIRAMKIWPFDAYALARAGFAIALDELKEGVAVVEEIRRRVGDRMDIMIEFHGLWQLAPALQIMEALRDLDVFWLEDPIAMHNLADLAAYRQRATTRVCGSEALGTCAWYREAFTRGAIDVAHFDMAWVGGISEGRRIAALAHAFDRPIAPHDCTGPVLLVANTHVMASQPNTLIAETVRAYYSGFYRDIVTVLPRIAEGYIYAMDGPGLGTALRPELLARADVLVQRSG
jgi:L-alanine-DL-glutamate epimerase-like enolase superfamily enzyme